jgi:hypothetical protein
MLKIALGSYPADGGNSSLHRGDNGTGRAECRVRHRRHEPGPQLLCFLTIKAIFKSSSSSGTSSSFAKGKKEYKKEHKEEKQVIKAEKRILNLSLVYERPGLKAGALGSGDSY